MYTPLKIFFARDVGKAVILRRGPSQWIQMILWHVDTDNFERGQWFRGVFYGGVFYGGDLSPDGKAFLYTAGKPHRRYVRDDYGWTVLSKPPYFTAFAMLALAPIGAGAVMFKDNEHILYTGEVNPSPTRHGGEFPKQFKLEKFISGKASPPINIADMFFYLEQHGWELKTFIPDDKKLWEDFWYARKPLIWHKLSTRGVLIRQALPYLRGFILRYAYNGQEIVLEKNDADFDQRGRLIATRDRKLLQLDPDDPNHSFTILADFEDQKPESLVPPDEVLSW